MTRPGPRDPGRVWDDSSCQGGRGSLFKGKMRPTMWGHSRVSEELTTEETTCQAGAQQTRAQNTQAGPAGRGPGGEGARFPSRRPHTAWELPPDFEFESQGERGREGVGTHLQRQSPTGLGQSRAGQAGWDPREESALGAAGSAQGALRRSSWQRTSSEEVDPQGASQHRGSWEAPSPEASPKGKAQNFQ